MLQPLRYQSLKPPPAMNPGGVTVAKSRILSLGSYGAYQRIDFNEPKGARKWGNGKWYSMQNKNKKKAAAAILVSDKINFKRKTLMRDKKGHYIVIKESI